MPTTNLTGRTVLIAPSDSQRRDLAAELERNGARVIAWPTLEIGEPQSYAALDDVIENLFGYDWLIFTSAHGVEYFTSRLQHLGHTIDELDALRVCAIGPTTARALEDAQIHIDLIPEQSTDAGILAGLETYAGGPGNLQGLNFLIPRAAIASDGFTSVLKDAGARVDVVAAYRTVRGDNSDLARISTLLAGGGIDCVVFAGVSDVQHLAQLFDTNDLSRLLAGVAVTCIDDTTEISATDCGLETAITPIEPTIVALARAIAAHFSV